MENTTQNSPLPSPEPSEDTSSEKVSQIDPAVSRLAMFMIAGVFVLILLGGILIAAGPKEKNAESAIGAKPTTVSTVTAGYTSSESQPGVAGATNTAPVMKNTGNSAPLISEHLGFDVNVDGRLDIRDIGVVANFIDSHQYSAIYDFNSDSVVDVSDLAEIRSAYKGYPTAEFDVNVDGKLNIGDIGVVANFIDAHQYSAVYDFNSDAVLDTKDLAMIRSSVSLAGVTAQEANY